MKEITPIICFVFFIVSLSVSGQGDINNHEIKQLQSEPGSLKTALSNESEHKKSQIATFLTFQKENAEEAMNFYITLFDNSGIDMIKRWGKDGPGKEGTIMHATFHLNGRPYMCSDSPAIHDWDFTPAISNFVECTDERELEDLFARLSENGKVMMPLNNYGFSQKFGFVEDKFGVSWQLNLQ